MSGIIQFVTGSNGQVISFAISTIGFIITVFTFTSVLSIRRKIKNNKKKSICIKSLNEIIKILDKNKNNFDNNPSDINERIISVNDQIIRNTSIIKKLRIIYLLRKSLVKQKKYYHFLHAYNEIVIDMEREEV
jgi:hypothetical protein